MSKLLSELRAWGCDVDGAMERFMGDEQLYRRCLDAVMEEQGFEGLLQGLLQGDVQGAFEQAHTLKGVLANMGLTPLYEIVVDIVEPLRAGSAENLIELHVELMEKKKQLEKVIGSL